MKARYDPGAVFSSTSVTVDPLTAARAVGYGQHGPLRRTLDAIAAAGHA